MDLEGLACIGSSVLHQEFDSKSSIINKISNGLCTDHNGDLTKLKLDLRLRRKSHSFSASIGCFVQQKGTNHITTMPKLPDKKKNRTKNTRASATEHDVTGSIISTYSWAFPSLKAQQAFAENG